MRKLVWRNLLRNKRRTIFTVASVTIAVLLLCVLMAVLATFEPAATAASENRVVVRHAVSLQFDLPEAYWRRLKTLDHVEAVTPLTWFGGIYKNQRPENFFAQFGADPATLLDVFTDIQIREDELAAWSAERRAFLAGRSLAEKYGWEIGDEIFLRGEIYPVDLNLTLRGIYTHADDESQERQLFFHRAYVEEALGNPGSVGTYWLRVDAIGNIPAVIETAEAMFENSQARVKAETEQAFALSFTEMIGNVKLLFGAIGLAVVVSVFFITANTMAMAMRERSTEIAVLKTLGFRRGRVLGLVTAESAAIGLLGGVTGVALAAVVLRSVANALAGVFPLFRVLAISPNVAALGVGVALVLGLLSGALPGWVMARRPVVDGLRRLG
ncbi:MAG: ABC transporter permease [Gemmatimonadota bacterium]